MLHVLKAFDLVEDHLRSSTNPKVLGQIHPTNHPTAVHKKFSRPRDVFAIFSCAWVQHSVFADDLRTCIRQKWEAIPLGLAELL